MATGILLAFTGVLAINLVRGKRPSCSCFGQIASKPIGWGTVVRNLLILSPALLLVFIGRNGSGVSVTTVVPEGADLELIAWGLLSVLSLALASIGIWLGIQLTTQNGRLLTRIELLEAGGTPFNPRLPSTSQPTAGLPVGVVAPSFTLPGVRGEVLTLDALRAAGKRVLLAFTDPDCGPCNALLPDLATWQRELASTVALTVITRGSEAENFSKSMEHGITSLLVEKEHEVSGTYLATATPSAVLINSDGTIASPLAIGSDEIRALVARSLAGSEVLKNFRLPVVVPPTEFAQPCPSCGQYHTSVAERTASRLGHPAPALRLPDLDGNTVNLEDYRARETLVLFWNTSCGFCQQMIPDLKVWEATRPKEAPTLLIVSTGTKEANEAQGFSSTVVLDENFVTGSAFGANGTPSAVLVSRDGKIGSELAVGKDAVLKLVQKAE
jgi:peroxiredoxin